MKRTAEVQRPTKEEIALLPPFEQLLPSQIHQIWTEAQGQIVHKALKAARFVGFDTETKPTFSSDQKTSGPHVVQFATTDAAFIISIGPSAPMHFLKEAIESEEIVKIGFGFKSDRAQLKRKFGIRLGATVDLAQQMKRLGYRQAVGVKAAVAIALKRRLSKSKSVTTSNWALSKLQPRQLQYAADDAHAALMVFHAIGKPYGPGPRNSSSGDEFPASQHFQGDAMLLGLRTAIYPVTDLARAKAWYAKVTGVQPYFVQPFYVGFEVGGFELGLVPDGTPGSSGPQPLWGVASASSAQARLLELGATLLDDVQEVGAGIKVGAVRDPFGNRLGFIENPGFDAGKVR